MKKPLLFEQSIPQEVFFEIHIAGVLHRKGTAYQCVHCKQVSEDRKYAQRCCAKHTLCPDCGTEVISLNEERCHACRRKKFAADADARWAKYTPVPWDGEAPIVAFFDGKWFFDADSLAEYLQECEHPEAVRLLATEQAPIPLVSGLLHSHYDDDIPDECEWDTTDIEKTLQAWMDDNYPTFYHAHRTHKLDTAQVITKLLELGYTVGPQP